MIKIKCEASLSRFEIFSYDYYDPETITAICGQSMHSKSTEVYYHEAMYDSKDPSDSIIIDTKENETKENTSLEPKIECNSKLRRKCTSKCKLDNTEMFKDLIKIFKEIISCSLL